MFARSSPLGAEDRNLETLHLKVKRQSSQCSWAKKEHMHWGDTYSDPVFSLQRLPQPRVTVSEESSSLEKLWSIETDNKKFHRGWLFTELKKRQFTLPVPVFKCLIFFYSVGWHAAKRGSYQCKMQKVQANLDPHLLEEAHHGFAGATPALIDIDNCVEPGSRDDQWASAPTTSGQIHPCTFWPSRMDGCLQGY